MEKTIKIDGKDVKFKATAGTIRQYRMRFGKDLLMDFKKLQDEMGKGEDLTADSLTIFENLSYCMAKAADPTIPDTADEWLDGFDMFSIYFVLPELVALWNVSNAPTVEAKKKA